MFVNSKVRAKITDADPVFKTRYLGNMEVFVPNGTGCTNAPVQKLWDNSGEEKNMKKVSTVINIHGIILKDIDNKKDEGKLFPIENISFCNAESIANGKIFSWISKEEKSPKLICHAVLCSTQEKAKSMALVMSRAFQIAYKEWKIERNNMERNERKDNVKNKTADLKLKPKYFAQQPGTSGLQTGPQTIQSEQSDNTAVDTKTKQYDNDEDSKSVSSSISSISKGSNDSKHKETQLQASDIQNNTFKETINEVKSIESTQSLNSSSVCANNTNKKDDSIQAGDKEVTETEYTLESERYLNPESDNQSTISQKL